MFALPLTAEVHTVVFRMLSETRHALIDQPQPCSALIISEQGCSYEGRAREIESLFRSCVSAGMCLVQAKSGRKELQGIAMNDPCAFMHLKILNGGS